jgi:hypothetical protein
MPTILRLGRFRFFFFSNEGHEPAHIHVESGDCYAKFWLDPVRLARSVGYNARELNELRKLAIGNVKFFKEKWHEHFGS